MRIASLNPSAFIIGALSLLLLVACAGSDASPTPTLDLEVIATRVAASRSATAMARTPTPTPTPAQMPTPTPTATSVPGHSVFDPADIGTPLVINVIGALGSLLGGDEHQARVTVLEVARGEGVWLSLRAADRDNTPPFLGWEYIAALIRFELLASDSGDTYGVSPNFFQAVSTEGREYELPVYFVFEPEPLSATLSPGDFTVGWAAFQIPTDERQPLLTGGGLADRIWFKLYDD